MDRGGRIRSRGPCEWGLLGLSAAAVASCGVIPPPYQANSGAGTAYCTSFLRFSQVCSAGTTAVYLTCICLAIVFGFLAAQLSNDPSETSLLKKHRSTFLFVGAATAGVLGAYYHSRADAASKAAADVESAMAMRWDWARYKSCLAAAAHWDGSRSESLDAANAAASDQTTSGNSKLLDSMQSASAARDHSLDATDQATKALSEFLGMLEQSSAARSGRVSKANLDDARKAIDEARASVASARKHSATAQESLETARQAFSSQDIGPAEGSPSGKPQAPHPDGGM